MGHKKGVRIMEAGRKKKDRDRRSKNKQEETKELEKSRSIKKMKER